MICLWQQLWLTELHLQLPLHPMDLHLAGSLDIRTLAFLPCWQLGRTSSWPRPQLSLPSSFCFQKPSYIFVLHRSLWRVSFLGLSYGWTSFIGCALFNWMLSPSRGKNCSYYLLESPQGADPHHTKGPWSGVASLVDQTDKASWQLETQQTEVLLGPGPCGICRVNQSASMLRVACQLLSSLSPYPQLLAKAW